MPSDTTQRPAVHAEQQVLQFARAFRTAARVVGFYPEAHPAVQASLDHVVNATRSVTATAPLVLTILPEAFLVGGVPLDSRETAVHELAEVLHRHGVGALKLKGNTNVGAWRALFELLALPSDEVRGSGGIQRRWSRLRHPDPVILEIDFGEMLRGRVGGDFGELAGVINHYLETAGLGNSFADAPYQVLLAALEDAADDDAKVAAIVNELRAGVQLIRMTQPERFDLAMKDAASIGADLGAAVMSGLLARRGTPEALVGTVDIVASLVERMTDSTIAGFLASAIDSGHGPSAGLVEVFTTLVPDPIRRARILPAAHRRTAAVAIEPGSVDRWAELERQLEELSDRQFVSEEYARELRTARNRSADVERMTQDPPERIAGWVRSLDDEMVDELDLRLLEDLAKLEHEAERLREVLGILLGRVDEAVDRRDWDTAERLIRAISANAYRSTDPVLRAVAQEVQESLPESAAADRAITSIESAEEPPDGPGLFILGIGPALIPRIVHRWMDAPDEATRERLDSLLESFGRTGREALRRMLSSPERGVKTAAIRLLDDESATDHLASLEALMSDASEEVRQEAFRALLHASSDRAQEMLARGIARVPPDRQVALIADVASGPAARVVPVLRRLVTYLWQPDGDPTVYLSVIDGLRRAGGDEAAAALRLVLERSSWRTPLRTLKVRSAAKDALRAIRSDKGRGES